MLPIYHLNSKGYAVYDHMEAIDVAYADSNTKIMHIVVESLPTKDEILK